MKVLRGKHVRTEERGCSSAAPEDLGVDLPDSYQASNKRSVCIQSLWSGFQQGTIEDSRLERATDRAGVEVG